LYAYQIFGETGHFFGEDGELLESGSNVIGFVVSDDGGLAETIEDFGQLDLAEHMTCG
jgi:hypothetical protein